MDIESLIRTVPDFPKAGIRFKDITPLLSNGRALRHVVDTMAERYRGNVDAIVGVESRGFLFGAPVAYALGVGLCIVRKPGKLPHDTHTVTYALEYGKDSLEIHKDALRPGARVAIVDDLLATGGTAKAAITLAEACGANVVECGFLIELEFLKGRAALAPVPVHSLLQYNGD
ncbi:MAG TPA: adenine phosphoribosyltransferase [Candidatus Limnocylindrales bacterium]|nr:adenine phosphoribosyltransferase [Candidatus Limnocylindrales bacterium]